MRDTVEMRLMDSEIGPLCIEGGSSITRVRFVEEASPSEADHVTRQLEEYFAGLRRTFDLELQPTGTAFQRSVWSEVAKIPYGETRTYREIAEALGDAHLARAVGAANGANPLPILIPCHRVVGADGSLTGYSAGLERKRWLLDHESPQGLLIGGPPVRRASGEAG